MDTEREWLIGEVRRYCDRGGAGVIGDSLGAFLSFFGIDRDQFYDDDDPLIEGGVLSQRAMMDGDIYPTR